VAITRAVPAFAYLAVCQRLELAALLRKCGVASEVGAPVAVKIRNDRYPASVESAAYFVVAELLEGDSINVFARDTAGPAVSTATKERPWSVSVGR
jgi:hypothetical protein